MHGWILVISREEAAMAREKGNTGLRGGLRLRNGIYNFRFKFKGEVVSGSTDCRDRKSAERWLLQFRSKLALENINLKETKIPTFGDCYDLWTKGRAPRLAETSLKMYRSHWRRVWSPWKDVRLTELQPHIDALYTAYKTGHADASQREMFSKLKSILNFAKERCIHNLPFDFPLVKVSHAPKVVLVGDEITTLFDHLNKIANLQQQVLIRSMFHLGLRVSEAYNLRWSGYDEARRTYTFIGKGGKEATLPVIDEMAEWFAKLPRVSDLMCPRPSRPDLPRATKYTDEVLKQAAAMMGLIGFSHHRLRASIATHLLNKGVPPTQVQAILRHESIHTTVAHYYQQDLKSLRTAMEAHHISTRPTDPDTFPKIIPFAC